MVLSVYSSPFLNDELSKRTAIFGLHMWVVVGICFGAAFVLLLFLISLWLASKRSAGPAPAHNPHKVARSTSSPTTIEDIQDIRVDTSRPPEPNVPNRAPQKQPESKGEQWTRLTPPEAEGPAAKPMIHIENGKDHRVAYPDRLRRPVGAGVGSGSSHASGESRLAEQTALAVPEVSHLGWGHWYTLRELEVATDMFADENVIGEGGYGIVYRGVLQDGGQVAVKNLLNNNELFDFLDPSLQGGQAEREFKVEVEAIGRVRHKNLVRLLGYCAEGAHRILVYEYVDNGNLEQWLHGDIGPSSPLTWEMRMNIVLGTAKGLVYLHEGLEPKVIHRDIKSSNILLDKHWNPRVSDFGLAKLLGSETSYVTTRVMGTFGYVAPEYASTGMLNERSDIYSFGILIMEIISGRSPVDYSRPPGEVNLVDWIKTMVTNRNCEGILDPKLPEKPSSRALKKALLVALRCVDPDAHKRPKMGHVLHMIEVDDFPFRDDRRAGRTCPQEKARFLDGPLIESGDSSGYESNTTVNRTNKWRKPEN